MEYLCYFTKILGNNEKFVQHLNINSDNLCHKNKNKIGVICATHLI